MDWGGQEKPSGKYAFKINEKESIRKTNTPNIFATFPASTLYNLLHEQGLTWQWGCYGWSEPGMRKYNKLYTAIKYKRKKSAPTLNQELLKVFQSQQK